MPIGVTRLFYAFALKRPPHPAQNLLSSPEYRTDFAPAQNMNQQPATKSLPPVPVRSMAALGRMAGIDIPVLVDEILKVQDPACLYMQQYQLFSTLGQHDFARQMQRDALALRRHYRVETTAKPAIRLLALMTEGDSTDNTPIDYLVESSDIQLDLYYVLPGSLSLEPLPEYDVAIICAGASEKNTDTLDAIAQMTLANPPLNLAERISACTRDGVFRMLESLPGIVIPATLRTTRRELEHHARCKQRLNEDGPLTIRPLDSQGGRALEKIEDVAQLNAYLQRSDADEFYLSRYVNYQSPDGKYRKLRIALIDYEPYLCHLAIGEGWIVHYNTAGMEQDAEKRTEEDAYLREFYENPALAQTLRVIAKRLALDYVVLDCALMPDGKLLIFEADNRGWVHATDPLDLFSYKQDAMKKIFSAFRAMLIKTMHTATLTKKGCGDE